MIDTRDDGIWLVLRESVSVHHEDLFAALTTGDGLSRWLCIEAEIDLREGGVIEFYWDSDRRRKTSRAILSYTPAGTITWDWIARMQDVHIPCYWSVTPSVETGCVVEFQQGPYADDVDSLKTLADEAVYWQWHLCNLRGVLEARHDMRVHRPL